MFDSCIKRQDLGSNQLEIGMLRKRSLPDSVDIDLEIKEVARDVRPRSSCEESRRVEQRFCTPADLQIEFSEVRCSTPVQSSESRCCTPPTFPIKSSEARSSEARCCTPLTNPMRILKVDIPLAPIRETLIARPTRLFNSTNEDRARMCWIGASSAGTSSVAKLMTIERMSGNIFQTAPSIS
jgi:hypothetical protein